MKFLQNNPPFSQRRENGIKLNQMNELEAKEIHLKHTGCFSELKKVNLKYSLDSTLSGKIWQYTMEWRCSFCGWKSMTFKES